MNANIFAGGATNNYPSGGSSVIGIIENINKGILVPHQLILPAGLYEIKKKEKKENDEDLGYFLKQKTDYFHLPNKIYGETRDDINRVVRRFKKVKESFGVLTTGSPGSGKTGAAESIADLIKQRHSVPIVMVTEIEGSLELIKFLSSLPECVLIFDEFGKNFNISMQEKMLSMFSSKHGAKKLFIATESRKNRLCDDILNRTGRFWYHFEFDKVSMMVIDEYFAGHNVTDVDFIKQVKDKFIETHFFTFDFLMAITEEHLDYPSDTLDDLIRVLNVKILNKPIMLSVIGVTSLDGKDEYDYSCSDTFSKEHFTAGRKFWIWLNKPRDPKDLKKFKNPFPKSSRYTIGVANQKSYNAEEKIWELKMRDVIVTVKGEI